MARYIDFLTAYNSQHWLAFATACLSQKCLHHLDMKLLVQMQTGIIDHTAERLTSMVLLPGIIRDIIPMAHRLRSLVRLQLAGRFDSDELGYVSAFLSARQRDIGTGHDRQEQDEDIDQNEQKGTGATNTDRKRPTIAVRGIEEFTLPFVTPTNSSPHHPVANKDLLARQTQIQQLDILRSLGQQLVSLDANNYSDFMKISHQVPCYLLKRLETFKYVQGALEGNAEYFLRRCRALRNLDFVSFHKDVFAWAVIEKQQQQQQQQLSLSQQQLRLQLPVQTTTATAPPTTPQPFSTDLVQLRQLRLGISQWFIGRSMQSITYAFSHSLEYLLLNVYDHRLLRGVLCAHTVARLEASATSDKPFRIDPHTLQMPRLKKLRLLRVNQNIVIGPAPFEGCPLLEDLSISGKIGFSIVSGKFEVLRIPLLKSLELATSTASLYQWASLQHSPLLETLVLVDPLPTTFPQPYGDNSGGFGDIFRSMHRPLGISSWTWTMVHLTRMHLVGPPAFQFRFEWIRRCPALAALIVDGLLPSTYLHLDLQDPVQRQEDDVYGKHLLKCELVIYNQNRKFDQAGSALARVLETYCRNITRLKLTGRANPQTDEGTATALAVAGQESWEHVDLGTALRAIRNLPHLKLLVSRIGSGPPLQTLVERYSLVRGTNVIQASQDQHGPAVAVWCPSIPFKDIQIELEDLVGSGSTPFRQRASWQVPDEEACHYT